MTVFHHQLVKLFGQNLLRAMAVVFALQMMFILPDFVNQLKVMASPLPEQSLFILQFILAVLDFILPLTLLLATLFTMGQLARNFELMPLSSAGWSLFQISWPLILVGFFALVFSVLLRILGLNMPPDLAFVPGREMGSDVLVDAFPVVNLLAVLTGIVLAAKPGHRSIYGQGGRALFVLMAYFVFAKTMVVLGGYEVVPPMVAGWLGIGVYFLVIGGLWRRAIN